MKPSKIARTLLATGLLIAINSAINIPLPSQAEVKTRTATVASTIQETSSTITAVDSVGITVADMDKAVEFYSQVLSFRKVLDVEVWGDEYEHLQGLFGVRPRDGRPLPPDARPNDLLNWQTTLVVKDAAAIAQKLQISSTAFISPSVVEIPGQILGFRKGFIVRDPDGHAIRIIEK
jgi:catechol 2,3-dioxygenase-like lactoylglutathione lyase family enzyme